MKSKKSSETLVRTWLRDAADLLADAGIRSALLDAEIILAHTLHRSRTWLHAHDDEKLSIREIEIASARLDLRLDRTPIAYIIGHKEFYSRLFKVTPSVLIPRPESESIITQLSNIYDGSSRNLIDVGTGSGCLGITAKLENPNLNVTLSDISHQALNIARQNARILKADVTIVKNNLLTLTPELPLKIDIIIANLPYVDRSWRRSPETNHEPALALFANDNGIALIKKLISQAPNYQPKGGYILIEADPVQHQAIISYAQTFGYNQHAIDGYCLVLKSNH